MKKCFSTKSSFLWLWHHSDFGQFFLLLSPNKSNNFFIYFLILLEASAPVNYICIVFAFLSVVKRGIDHWALNFTSCDNGLRTDIKDKVIPNNITAEPLFSINPFFLLFIIKTKNKKSSDCILTVRITVTLTATRFANFSQSKFILCWESTVTNVASILSFLTQLCSNISFQIVIR